MAKILVTEKMNQAGMQVLYESGHEIVTMETRDRAELMEKMKDADGMLVRAGIIDENALIEALASGHLGGAGLDVTAVEPCPPDSPLFAMPNVLLTPHYASNSEEASVKVAVTAAQGILDCLAGRPVAGRL